ncbi:enoyl-CoA hydratase/isomerase family protein [Ramlibacter henchirensis]|uniref:Enoyl-CoA hydratase/isomerase family protein n=1 Tax=Ramlibacter henchirensis TaxID=204072 RepID=A0A4Z0BW94_9BURK|nr:enoyl-CoA hydratase/isomerase family protein [Ramlibacter henchirensis]TFZ02754.1 enoyl-CoA hydratase/isomerase family protein [Ramlibacter henchirensis]
MQASTKQGSGENVRIDERSGAVWITVDRAQKHNALARPVLNELATAVRSAGAREDVRYIVVTGAGDKYFAAGGDLRDLANVRDEAAVMAMMEEAAAALDAIRHCPVPVIALLNGDAIGGGAELALACDMRLQSAHARIGYIQAKLAITSAWGGGPDLFQLIGPAHAMRMMSRCELVGAEQALAWGLADAVIRDGAGGDDLKAFLEPLDACAPQVLRGIKAQAIAARQGAGWKAHRAVEQQHLVRTWLHDDHWAASEKLLSKGS